MIISCPVCLRQVSITDHGRVRRHNDTANNLCVMFGHHYPLEYEREAS